MPPGALFLACIGAAFLAGALTGGVIVGVW